jgi:inorganic pyrophosphatase/K(+)-stimulated pyrophosphate-energized sodium pump
MDGVALWWFLSLGGALGALGFAWGFYRWMLGHSEGDAAMADIAGHVRTGARTYLKQQYRIVALFFAAASAALALMAFGLGTQSQWVPFAFLTGGFFSGLAGWFGMMTSTQAGARTAQACKTSLNSGLQVAFRSGAVMGLTVVGLGLLDICLWFGVLRWGAGLDLTRITVTMLCFGMGASSQALFARVGGGIFTKAADVGADLVGKVEEGIPEDDPRNPATIADNVGDNVGDVAGMGADLYESYCGSILATAALGVAAFRGFPDMQQRALMLPIVLAASGIVLSIAGIFLVRAGEQATQKNLLTALNRGINVGSIGIAAAALLLVWRMLVVPSQPGRVEITAQGLPAGNALFGVFGAIATGLVAGVSIGKWTGYATSADYAPTRRIADQSLTGPATVIIAGLAEGFSSVWAPILAVCAAILIAFGFCTGFQYHDPQTFTLGLYGIGIASVGLLSTLGITLSTDAYGPVADNAGGNAEMTHQDAIVRERTDALDALGNTTAATGKGFAIASAALTALALLAAYVEEVRTGFERWADRYPAVTAAESDDSVPVLKITDTLVAAAGSAAGGRPKNVAWLVYPPVADTLPDDVRRIADAAPETIVNVDLAALQRDGSMGPVHTATIRDFARYYEITIMNPEVLVGLFLGGMAVFVFCSLTMRAVGRAAGAIVENVRRQFRENAGILDGTAAPDYESCIRISTRSAQRQMIAPALVGLLVPVGTGLLLGVAGVMGLLAGSLGTGFAMAVMMANAGGAWDNAKKSIEAGAHGGKGSDAHKASIVGDTVGDPFKDTSGPSLNILIKLMSMVSVVCAGLVVQYSLQALGLF